MDHGKLRCDGRWRVRAAGTWEQDIHAGNGDQGKFLYHAYWCDEHAGRIKEKRRVEWSVPPKMVQIAVAGEE